MKRPVLAAIALTAVAAPATASAATIQVASTPAIVYAAAPGEVNALEMHGTVGGPFDFRMPFFEYSAPLSVGPGCAGAQPTLCGAVDHALPVSVSLADGNDVANTNSFTAALTMSAGAGNDDVLAGGIDASADGGAGDDKMVLAANNLATGTGGAGNDAVAAGLGAAAAQLDGGNGDDLLVSDTFAFSDVHGGFGNDSLVALSGTRVTLSGDTGSDVLVASDTRQRVTLDGGADNDILYGHAGGLTVTAGAGNDSVDVRGGSATAADTVTCGAGRDVVWADAEDAVAGDCEKVRLKTAPIFGRVIGAEAYGRALLAHRPDPSTM